ncbi:hypothetical protein ACHQM5_006012 [Ranunculus cassubicifolius]
MELFRFFLSFLVFYTIMVSSEDKCLPGVAMCSVVNQPTIQFPFSIDVLGNCAYPGFNISCNEQNKATIRLGSWGDFLLRDVDYFRQEVQIFDQNNCLPKRLLNIDLSSSPFRGADYENFTFYNCSSEFSSDFGKFVSCLSTPNQTIYATSNSSTREMFRSCNFIKSIMVPKSRYRIDFNKGLHLVWDTPDCRACLRQQGECEFKNKKSKEIKCSFPLSPPKNGFPRSAEFAITLGAGIPILLCFVLLAWFVADRYSVYNRNNNHVRRVESASSEMRFPIVSIVGLDESIIHSYPETVIGESLRLTNPEDNTCSICLSEYQAKETLRTIPDCKHHFHATCIDEWLRQNVTCPICRNSPTLLPFSP